MNCTTGLAASADGLHWTARNPNLISGIDGEVIPLAPDLWLMFYGPEGFFDQAGCDIRAALYHGSLAGLAGNENSNKASESLHQP